MPDDERVPKKIYEYLVRAKPTICDDCLKQALALPNRNQASQATSAFGVTPGFKRGPGTCGICGKHKTVIQTA